MTVSDEKLMAFIDGQLPPAESQAMEKRVAEDAALLAYVERQRALKAALAGAFNPLLSEDIPPSILQTLRQAPPASGRRFSPAALFGKWRAGTLWIPVGGALAAGAICGAILTLGFSSPVLLRNEGGSIIAQGALADALSSDLAANTVANNAAHIGVTFRAHDGRFCRTFTSEDDQGALAGIACRTDAQWRVAAVSAAEKTERGVFHQAGSALPDAIRDAVAGMMAGAPLDAEAERAARDRGWR